MTQVREAFVRGDTAPDLLAPARLHEFFERQADASPGATALACDGRQISYGELEAQANRLARLLDQQGCSPGGCVGLLLPRSRQVYVALLAILKAGAAYVPLDPGYPAERIRFILEDCQARLLVTTRDLADKTRGFQGQVLVLEEWEAALAEQSPARLHSAEPGAAPHDLCYIIYTSGSTGRPKGVAIEHRSVCHLVRAEAQLFQIRPDDRVYQGFSMAFDASVEEIWLAFFAGATLVAGTEAMQQASSGLARRLAEEGVSVLSCVPTLLAMLDGDIPSLRLLILGGEVCPPELVKRWWRPGRRLVNTYGPTEATVIATYSECHPEKPVTIGRPLPNGLACVLDEQLRPVADGQAGELCLGGVGLARGYVGSPELTQQKFVFLPSALGSPERLYRTGDLARWTSQGELEFLGRADAQVKIRGFRVELTEIEAVLGECPGVKAAAVTLCQTGSGLDQLVGYVVPRGDMAPDEASLRERLRARLPGYMVPAFLQCLPALPILPSGKVDRRALPPPQPRPADRHREVRPPRNETERRLAEIWQRLFAPMPVCIKDDFFLELGGHSLLAAHMVSELRKLPALQHASMLDVYQHPTIESLAARLEEGRPGPAHGSAPNPGPAAQAEAPRGVAFWRHFWCGAAQLLSLVFVLSFFGLQWLTPYLTYTVLIEEEYEFWKALLGAFASLIAFYPLMLAVPIALKWLVIGRYKPGAYPLWGTYYFRWWLVTTLEAAVPVSYLAGTPLLNIYLRLMGARIGRNVYLASDSFAIYDLLSIGENSSINADAHLVGYTVENGWLKLGRVTIGRRCFVGTRAGANLDTTIEDDAALEDLSLLPQGMTIPRGETWLGSPAARRSAGDAPREPASEGPSAPASPHLRRRFAFGCLHGMGLLIFPVLVVAALFPGIVVMNQLNYLDPYYWYLFLAPLVGLSFIVLLGLEIAGLKWLLLGRVKAGAHPLHSFYYVRKWFVDQTMDLSLEVLGPLYASVYLKPWYTLLGAKLGRGTEISTASFISPDLLSIGDESFIADNVSLGAPRVRHGQVTLGQNHIGKRSFIGNSALLPPGTVIGDQVLIGCLSAPPTDPAAARREDTAWLGSPALFLPERQKSTAFPATTTFHPSPKLRAQRAIIEFVRVISPSTCFIVLISLLFSALLLLHDHFRLWPTLCFFPLLYAGCAAAAAFITIAAKWLLVGRYAPAEKPLWSTFVWRNELVNALHEHLAEPFLAGALGGTPFLCWYFRLLGARLGRRVYMETTDLTEFDLVRVGDEAALNADCTLQTHLFEDRVMKMSTVEIGARCTIGAGSLVLYDTRMESGASLDALSLLMKGEVLPADTRWQGIPASAVPGAGSAAGDHH